MPDQRRAKAAAHPGQQPADHIQRPVHAEIDTGPGDGGGNGHQQGAGPQAMPEQEGQGKGKADGAMDALLRVKLLSGYC